jgi:hypothetical protein
LLLHKHLYTNSSQAIAGRRRRKGVIKREGQAIEAAEEEKEERKGR